MSERRRASWGSVLAALYTRIISLGSAPWWVGWTWTLSHDTHCQNDLRSESECRAESRLGGGMGAAVETRQIGRPGGECWTVEWTHVTQCQSGDGGAGALLHTCHSGCLVLQALYTDSAGVV